MSVLTWPRTVARVRAGRTDVPRFLTYLVTFRCNARCVMCDSWRKEDTSDELTVADVRSIFAQLPRMDAVRLSGGEPFVRKDFPELLQATADLLRPHYLHVTTNGFLTERIIECCEQRHCRTPLALLVSLDGVGEKHDSIRGVPRAWERAMTTLQTLAPRQRELRLRLAVNQTIVDADGHEQYLRLRDVLRPLGIPHHVVIGYAMSATYHAEAYQQVAPEEAGSFSPFGDVTAEEWQSLLETLTADLPAYPWPERLAKRYYYRGIANRLLAQRGTPNPLCVALNSHLRLYPNGDVPICQFNATCVGNLKTQPFADFWHDARVLQGRHWVRRCPGCWAECEVLPNALYSGDLLCDPLRRK